MYNLFNSYIILQFTCNQFRNNYSLRWNYQNVMVHVFINSSAFWCYRLSSLFVECLIYWCLVCVSYGSCVILWYAPNVFAILNGLPQYVWMIILFNLRHGIFCNIQKYFFYFVVLLNEKNCCARSVCWCKPHGQCSSNLQKLRIIESFILNSFSEWIVRSGVRVCDVHS